jgi:NAD-dependent SIR2 family protein deacetylase
MLKQAKAKANKTAIFLGAGASAAEGAPMQNALFREYFSSKNILKLPEVYDVLGHFFQQMFGIDLKKPIGKINFPTFEEALGLLDLSEMRRESLRGLTAPFDGPENQPTGAHALESQIPRIRLYLTLVMAKSIADGLKKQESEARKKKRQPLFPHRLLIKNLKSQGLLAGTIFISTNYDLLIDEALGMNLDYGVDFGGAQKFGDQRKDRPNVKLFKIHGSLNWLYCPVCNNLNGYDAKVVVSLLYPDRPITQCEFCRSVMSPVIVPPTFYKDMSRVFLSSIWNKAENAMREVDHVIFCGYSLPDADMHVKYLLKRMQTNRTNAQSVRFTVVNHHPKKTTSQAGEEKAEVPQVPRRKRH